MTPVVIIPQPKVAGNDTIEKLMAVILQLKVISNDTSKEGLIDLLVSSQLDSLIKTLMDS